MDVCHMCGSASSLRIWNIGVTIIILSHEDTSGVNEFMHESTYNRKHSLNVSHDDDDDVTRNEKE